MAFWALKITRSAPAARQPRQSYSAAASTMTGTPAAWQAAANSGRATMPVCTQWWEMT
jgi:hypothetical protein